ncbi:hypothetical protein [Actinoplanes sp. NPDC048796]|uniref:hypothetical protein n=1 Tax=Actinoplanes sp. NPDC048796 TaxID=3155640 RepID=UPI0033F05C03
MAAFPASAPDVALPINSSCGPQRPPSWAATAARPAWHTDSDLHVFLRWCTNQDLNPLTTRRVDVERYVRWLQEVRQYQPSTVSRRLSVLVGF